MRHLRTLFILLVAASTSRAQANNIQVSNVTLTGQNTTTDTWQVQFNLSWENSWRTSTLEANYDAAWVFIKFKAGLNPNWRHATLSATGQVAATGSTITIPADLKGAFIYRTANGTGNVNYTGTQLRWNYGADGVADGDLIEVKVMAIEMVWIPSGAFMVGDGSGTGIQGQFEAGNTGAPFTIGSEAAITLGQTPAVNLSNHSFGGDDFSYITVQTLPAAFPKGFNAFYAMKYEMTEEQYVDFLNTLTVAQITGSGLFPNTSFYGHTIDDTGLAPNTYVTAAPNRVCGQLSGVRGLAYADWAALRPMTELEYEKCARGNRPPVANEYAWGSGSIRSTAYALTNAGLANETVNALATEGNAFYNATQGPTLHTLRAGVFAGSLVGPSREAAGAGYYGAMELSGNGRETCITVGNSQGRVFTGVHGDGSLATNGAHNATNWPTTGSPFKPRGGHGFSSAANIRTSDRNESLAGMTSPNEWATFRLVRTQ